MTQSSLGSGTGSKGVIAAGGAFLFWGLAPLYWKTLQSVAASELLAHRIVWALPLLLVIVARRKAWAELGRALSSPRTLSTLLVTTILIAGNWFVFVWAIETGHVLDTSLGYYINPLISVLLGAIFLGERLRRVQRLALLLAFLGVATLTVHYGRLPRIALFLAVSFGLYGLLRKTVQAGAIAGLSLEMTFLAPFAVFYLAHLHHTGRSAFLNHSISTDLLAMAAGPVTVLPLLAFTYGARRLPLRTIGFLQYLTPTGHFLLAVWVFGEPFGLVQLMSFLLIWTALAVYSSESQWQLRRSRSGASP